MSERHLLADVLRMSVGAVRLFRNNVVNGWVGSGEVQIHTTKTIQVYPGDVVLHRARRIQAGLCVGSSDAIGWVSREITSQDVGKTFALFTAVECKSEDGRPTQEQLRFIDAVQRAGGLAGIARSVEQAEEILTRK